MAITQLTSAPFVRAERPVLPSATWRVSDLNRSSSFTRRCRRKVWSDDGSTGSFAVLTSGNELAIVNAEGEVETVQAPTLAGSSKFAHCR